MASEYKQALAPKTPALIIAPILTSTFDPIVSASGITMGMATTYNPHDEPVVNDINESEIKISTGKVAFPTYGATDAITYSVNPILSPTSFRINEITTKAKANIIELNPENTVSVN